VISAKNIRRIVIALLVLGGLSIQNVQSQSFARPAPGYKNTLGAAISTGFFLNKDAYFWGLGADYSRLIGERYVINISMAFDQEISKTETKGTGIVNTLSPSLALGYVFNSRFALGIGLGKGAFDDDNDTGMLEYNKNGDWTIALIGVYTFYQKGPHGFDISLGVEQGIGNADLDVTAELGYGFSF
jgi:hypothetical protein